MTEINDQAKTSQQDYLFVRALFYSWFLSRFSKKALCKLCLLAEQAVKKVTDSLYSTVVSAVLKAAATEIPISAKPMVD